MSLFSAVLTYIYMYDFRIIQPISRTVFRIYFNFRYKFGIRLFSHGVKLEYTICFYVLKFEQFSFLSTKKQSLHALSFSPSHLPNPDPEISLSITILLRPFLPLAHAKKPVTQAVPFPIHLHNDACRKMLLEYFMQKLLIDFPHLPSARILTVISPAKQISDTFRDHCFKIDTRFAGSICVLFQQFADNVKCPAGILQTESSADTLCNLLCPFRLVRPVIFPINRSAQWSDPVLPVLDTDGKKSPDTLQIIL